MLAFPLFRSLRLPAGALLGAAGIFLAAVSGSADGILRIQKTAPEQYRISWSASLPASLVLHSTIDLVNPDWQPVPESATIEGEERQVVTNAPGPRRFFRLICPGGGQPDLPDDDYTDSNCDGIDGDESAAIFVAGGTGNNANPGTRSLPVLTLSTAIARAVQQGKTQIYAAGLVAAGSTINLANGVSIYGGYSAPSWSRSASNVTSINIPGARAVVATNITSPTVLDHLSIRSANQSAAGESSYALTAIDSSALTVRKSTIRAGNGAAAGVVGANGIAGEAGSAGGSGAPGCEHSQSFGCSTCGRPPGGGAGGSPCSRTGGAGGLSGLGSNAGAAGGTGVGGTLGGNGGASRAHGQAGSSGAAGTAGANGAAGAMAFTSSGYAPTAGADGGLGTDGNGGGGGGGGGGGTSACVSYGSTGGGGGGGGCRGTAATGGSSGGGSIAVYLWNSDVTLQDCSIVTAAGGSGGNGGTGGAGGVGGPAGPGGPYGGAPEQDDAGNGGPGGVGGAGGRGGHGGGGAGGPSIGIVKGGTSSPTLDALTFTLGSGGSGGASDGNPGPAGTVADVFPLPSPVPDKFHAAAVEKSR